MTRFRLLGMAALTLAAGCNRAPTPDRASARRAEAAADSGFAALQQRGQAAMGVDQFTSTHQFVPLADGGRKEQQRDSADSAVLKQIRMHMRQIAAAFRKGDFSLPGFVHDQAVPGTDVMAARRSAISYDAMDLPLGGAVRITTTDTTAIRAIHDFLAFQRQDHHAGGGP
jgi:hypothetical protein